VKKLSGCASNHYTEMRDSELAALRPMIDTLAAKDCALIMWATFPKMESALSLIRAWGFEYKTCWATWIKVKKGCMDVASIPVRGLGTYTRSNAEVCLLATRGKVAKNLRRSKSIALSSVIHAPRRAHSQKPDEARTLINDYFTPDATKIELFARLSAPEGWDVWGNEVGKLDI